MNDFGYPLIEPSGPNHVELDRYGHNPNLEPVYRCPDCRGWHLRDDLEELVECYQKDHPIRWFFGYTLAGRFHRTIWWLRRAALWWGSRV